MLVAVVFELGLLLLLIGVGLQTVGAAGMRLSIRPGCVSLAAVSRRTGRRLMLLGLYFAVATWATTLLVWVIVKALGGE